VNTVTQDTWFHLYTLTRPKYSAKITHAVKAYLQSHTQEQEIHTYLKIGYICSREHRRKWCKPTVIPRVSWLLATNHGLHWYLLYLVIVFLLFLHLFFSRTMTEQVWDYVGEKWEHIDQSVSRWSLPPFAASLTFVA